MTFPMPINDFSFLVSSTMIYGSFCLGALESKILWNHYKKNLLYLNNHKKHLALMAIMVVYSVP